MKFIAEYYMPILAGLIIIMFYLCLPQLDSCPLERKMSKKKAAVYRSGIMEKADWLIALTLTALYAVAAFTALGDTAAPKSYWQGGEQPEYISLAPGAQPDRLMYFSGITVGSFYLEGSADGESYSLISCIEQNSADVIRWREIELPEGAEGCTHFRISASGSPRMAELAFYEGEKRLEALGPAALFDEQQLVPEEMDYMNSSYFDEIYHVRTAQEHIEELPVYEISHPPLGKLIISLGIRIFGLSPFGWRFMGTLLGVLMLPIMYVFSKKLFDSRNVSACCTAVFAAEFMHFTQTRMATIDTYSVFFILLMYLLMYLWLNEQRLWQLALSGLFFGLGAASKWTCLYAGAGLGLLWLLYWLFEGREKGLKAFWKNVGWCMLFFVAVPGLIYYLSYYPYGAAEGLHGIGAFFKKRYMEIVLGNQEFMLSYHSGVHAEHPYSSPWYKWVFNIRPILYYLHYFDDGSRSSFGAFLNPAVCWGGLLALFVLIYTAVFRRDKKAGFILLGYLAQLVPWMFVGRTVFEYHYFPSSVFLILALGYVFRLMELSGGKWKRPVYGFTAFCVVLFVMFYPALSGMRVDSARATELLGWLPTWPF